jgi:hypothetical protein
MGRRLKTYLLSPAPWTPATSDGAIHDIRLCVANAFLDKSRGKVYYLCTS